MLGVAAHERQDDVSPLWVVVQECDLLGGVLDDVGVAQHPLPEQLQRARQTLVLKHTQPLCAGFGFRVSAFGVPAACAA